MNGPPSDAQAKALEFVNSASSYVLLATIALLAWVASGVEFSNDGLRVASMACLTLSVIFGVATLALIPLVQEARRPGQSNFEVEARFMLSRPARRAAEIGAAAAISVVARRPHLLRHRHDRLKSATASSCQLNR